MNPLLILLTLVGVMVIIAYILIQAARLKDVYQGGINPELPDQDIEKIKKRYS